MLRWVIDRTVRKDGIELDVAQVLKDGVKLNVCGYKEGDFIVLLTVKDVKAKVIKENPQQLMVTFLLVC